MFTSANREHGAARQHVEGADWPVHQSRLRSALEIPHDVLVIAASNWMTPDVFFLQELLLDLPRTKNPA